jgi:hypothetical protein
MMMARYDYDLMHAGETVGVAFFAATEAEAETQLREWLAGEPALVGPTWRLVRVDAHAPQESAEWLVAEALSEKTAA